MGQAIPGKVEAPTQITDKKPVLHNPLNQMNTIFPTENRSLADLNTSGLGSYLSSSIRSSFVPQTNLLKPQGNPFNNHSDKHCGLILGFSVTFHRKIKGLANHNHYSFLAFYY